MKNSILSWGKNIDYSKPLETQRNVTFLEYLSIGITKFGLVIVSTLSSFGNVFLYECYYGSAGITSERVADISAVQTTITFILGYAVGAITGIAAYKFKSRLGRYRHYYIICLIPTALITILSYYVPEFDEGGLILFKYVLAVLNCVVAGFFGLAHNITQVISPNSEEKKFIVVLQQIAYYLGYGGAYLYFLVFGELSDNTRMRYLSLAIIGALITAIGSVMSAAFCKERIDPVQPKKTKLTSVALGLFKYKNYLAFHIFNWVGVFAAVGVMITYLAAIVVGSNKSAAFALPSAIGTAVGVLICTFLSKRFSPVQILKFVGIYSTVTACLTFFTVMVSGFGVGYYITYFMFGLSLGLSELSGNQFTVEFNDYLEWQTGQRLEAVQGIIPGWIRSVLDYGKNLLIPFFLASIGYVTSQNDNLLETMKATEGYESTCLWLLGVALFGYALSCLIKSIVLHFMYDVDGENKKRMYEELGVRRSKERAEVHEQA